MTSARTSGPANNPSGYVDQYGSKHEWPMHGEWVEHRVGGVIHDTQHLQGFLDYGVPELYRKASRADLTQLVRDCREAVRALEKNMDSIEMGTQISQDGTFSQ